MSLPGSKHIQMHLEGSHAWKQLKGEDPTGGVSNYLSGNDRSKWQKGIPHYRTLRAANVYDGVDALFYGSGQNLEYDLIVNPGAKVSQIELAFEGVRRMRLDWASGDLVLSAGDAAVHQARPKIYQLDGDRHVEVAGGYQITGARRATFTVGAYDHSKPLIIDPRLDATVNAATFMAGNDMDSANGVAMDAAGNAYVTGSTRSLNFATTAQSSHHGGFDVFIAKIAPNGTILVSTLLTGNSDDFANAIAIDDTGVYIAGNTHSSNFLRTQFGGQAVGSFVMKLNFDLSGVLYSTLVGASPDDIANAVAVDKVTHHAYVTGQTYAPNFPLKFTLLPGQTYLGANAKVGDAFVYRLAADGSLVYSNLLGGSSYDVGRAIAVDYRGGVWVGGQTCSADFPLTSASQMNGGCPGFLMRWSANFSSLSFSKFYAVVNALAVNVQDINANAYVTGSSTTSSSVSISKVDPSGNAIYERVVGANSFSSSGSSIAVNSAGQVYVGGSTNDSNFPGAFPAPVLPPMPPGLGYTYGFISRFSPDLSKLDYSEFVGDAVHSIAVGGTLPWVSPSLIYTAGYRIPSTPVAGRMPQASEWDAMVSQWSDDPNLPALSPLVRLHNYWKRDEYVNVQAGSPQAGAIEPGWWSAQWIFERQVHAPGDPLGAPVFWIHNRWRTDEYLNIENGVIQSSPIPSDSSAARWVFEHVPGTDLYRIRNVLHSDQYLNVQPGFLTTSTIEPGWWSAMWNIEQVF